MPKSKLDYKKNYQEYLKKGVKLDAYQKWGVFFLVVVIAGFVGWVYEFLFYFLNGGCTEWYMQGGNLLPWINIYAIGAVAIVATTYKMRKNPLAVFLVSVVVTGLVELIGGWLVYTLGNGTRYWDYNTEILNFGNIGGFVCLRSVLVFGVSALLLVYVIVPFCMYLARVMSRRVFLILSVSLFSLVMVDEATNLILKNLGQPTAMDFWRGLGLRYPTG